MDIAEAVQKISSNVADFTVLGIKFLNHTFSTIHFQITFLLITYNSEGTSSAAYKKFRNKPRTTRLRLENQFGIIPILAVVAGRLISAFIGGGGGGKFASRG